jgi:FKBP-type peptidyl-prolyl cis-trans isomerase
MIATYFKLLLVGLILTLKCSGFRNYGKCTEHPCTTSLKALSNGGKCPEPVSIHREKIILETMKTMSTVFMAYSALTSINQKSASAATSSTINPPPTPNKGFQTKTGLKYFDFVEGTTGTTPKYGQLVSFHYVGYYRATPESKLDLFDSTFSPASRQSFLHKHGNGRVIRGIDEGLHTMRVGGKRRVIIPKNIGYERFGMGPVPTEPSDRRKLGKLLDLLEVDKGELIFDLELVLVADDENDQGYYEDEPVTQDEVRKLVLKSMDADVNNGLLMDKMIQTTPGPLFKK